MFLSIWREWRFLRRFLVWEALLLLLLAIGASSLWIRLKLEPLADSLAQNLQTSLKAQDLPEAMALLESSLEKGFHSARFFQEGEVIFAVAAAPSSRMMHGHFRRPLPVDPDTGLSLGWLEFEYERWPLLPGILFLWFIGVLGLWAALQKFRRHLVLAEEKHPHPDQSFSRAAHQVAHDLRAPLAVLGNLEPNQDWAPTQARLFRAAVGRLSEVADDLTRRPESPGAAGLVSLSAVLEQSLSQAKLRLGEGDGLNWELRMEAAALSSAASLQPDEVRRTLKALFNLVAGGLRTDTKVNLNLGAQGPEAWELRVETGSGGLDCLAAQGIEGLQAQVHGWGGQLEFDLLASGKISYLSLRIPRAVSIFAPARFLKPGLRALVIEDDLAVQGAWERRLRKRGIRVTCLDSPPEKVPEAELYLVDEDYLGVGSLGLDWILSKRLADRALLVSHRFEDPMLLKRCREAGVPLLPKNLLEFWASV